jgi:hypothetical protein
MLIVAVTISCYWSCVLLMVSRSWWKYRGPAGAIPRTRLERRLWFIWVPNTAAWITLPWLAWDSSFDGDGSAFLMPMGALAPGAHWAASLLAVGALASTAYCWLAMGSSWSMAVLPQRNATLLTGGPFALVRHPIYSMSLLLMGCTLLVVGTWSMVIVAIIHALAIVVKAISEERFLLQFHGPAYALYCQSTGRFIPTWSRIVRPSTSSMR